MSRLNLWYTSVVNENIILIQRGGGYMGKHNKNIHMVTFMLLVIGGLNMLLIGLFGLDLIARLGSVLMQIIFILIGASAVYELATHKMSCKTCSMGDSSSKSQTPPMQE